MGLVRRLFCTSCERQRLFCLEKDNGERRGTEWKEKRTVDGGSEGWRVGGMEGQKEGVHGEKGGEMDGGMKGRDR